MEDMKGLTVPKRRKAEKSRAASGQSLAEYGLCLALISVICITALSSLGNNLNAKIVCIAAAVGGGNNGGGFGGGGSLVC